jgi:TonB family protein
MQRAVTQGEARVVICVDATGELTEWLVIGYTQPEFADSAVAAIKVWKFEAARLQGEPVGVTAELSFYYTAQGVVVSSQNLVEMVEAQTMRMLDGRYLYQPCALSELDRLPVPVATVAPVYPRELAQKGVQGTVEVEFYIDQTGAVRLPSVTTKDNLELSRLAVAALNQWKFTPPTSRGRGVLVKAVQTFNFKDGS